MASQFLQHLPNGAAQSQEAISKAYYKGRRIRVLILDEQLVPLHAEEDPVDIELPFLLAGIHKQRRAAPPQSTYISSAMRLLLTALAY